MGGPKSLYDHLKDLQVIGSKHHELSMVFFFLILIIILAEHHLMVLIYSFQLPNCVVTEFSKARWRRRPRDFLIPETQYVPPMLPRTLRRDHQPVSSIGYVDQGDIGSMLPISKAEKFKVGLSFFPFSQFQALQSEQQHDHPETNTCWCIHQSP